MVKYRRFYASLEYYEFVIPDLPIFSSHAASLPLHSYGLSPSFSSYTSLLHLMGQNSFNETLLRLFTAFYVLRTCDSIFLLSIIFFS